MGCGHARYSSGELMFALVDCNNFYASCERLFRPDLRNEPIVVLSNNDGCVIARSNEAKALGIAMGVPHFKIKALCKQHHVRVFSSNYTLYGDLSQRVMNVIEENWPHVEIYSIDEAFLDLSSLDQSYHDVFCKDLQQTILRHTGIPTSIGIGLTKTLAKLANHIAKKELVIPVFNLREPQNWLQRIDVGEVWGVGRAWHKKLLQHGINTAQDLAVADPVAIKNQFNVMLQRTHLELNGIPCAKLAVEEPQKNIISSRSFGIMQTEYKHLAQAISSHCARACEKLRNQHLLAQHLSVSVYANRFRYDQPQYYNTIDFRLVHPTDDIRYLTQCAKFCLQKIYRTAIQYKKVGIQLGDLTPRHHLQMDLFNQPSSNAQQRTEQFMNIIDSINCKFGSSTIRLAAEGYNKPWSSIAQLKSPSYTTQWSELPVVTL